jgi:SP family arabinose:H+ symporter-like MFS transporter
MNRTGRYVFSISFVATIGGLLFGFDTAIIAGAMRYLKDQFLLNSLQEGWAVSSVLVGCILGALIAGPSSDRLGRKRFLIVSAFLFLISAVGSAIAPTIIWFMAARFIGGIGIGAAAMLSPLYIAEVSPARIRGRLVSLNQMAIVTGILLAYFTNWALAGIGPNNWRWMFASGAAPSLIFIVLLLRVPESPRWLVKQSRLSEATYILKRINDPQQAELEIQEIQKTIGMESASLFQLFQPGLRRALIIGVVLAVLQQITGINAVLYYAPRIFEHAGFARTSAILQSAIVGLVNMMITLVAIFLVDKLGRKRLLLSASAGMGVSLAFLGIAFHLNFFTGPWVLIFILLYIAFFALAMGPVVWVVLSEIFPTRIRGRAMSVATVCLWAANFVVSLTFPVMADRFNESYTFWVYSLMCVITFFFVKMMLPETKGKSLEQIERDWR